jgi:amidase
MPGTYGERDNQQQIVLGKDGTTEPCDLTAVEARRQIGSRQLSPVDLMRSCIHRIEAVDHAVNAIPARNFERALADARAAEAAVMAGAALGPLHGLPLGVKDLIDAEGLPSTFGSPLFAGSIAAADEGAVARLRSAGAIVVGKTNTPEWGAGGNTRNAVYGATGNPFNPMFSAAGSSGGSAAALACGMVPLATGSDTGGSLRNPAAYCGVVGFRPTPGLIPAEKRNMAWIQLSTLGPMARTVGDAALMLSAMAGYDRRDSLAQPHNTEAAAAVAQPARIDLSRLRAAATTDFGFAPTERIVADALRAKTAMAGTWFQRLSWGHPDCSGADRAFSVLRAVLFLGRHRDILRASPAQVGPNVTANIEEGLSYSAADVAEALSLQTAMYRRWQTFFDDHDILLAPSVTVSPRPWRELYPAIIDGQPTQSYFHWLALAYAVTLTGHPVVSLPVGRDGRGMPFGLQVIGPRGGDAFTLGVAAALEAAFAAAPETSRPIPDIAALQLLPPLASVDGFKSFD